MRRPGTFRSKLLLALLGFVLIAELAIATAVLQTTYAQTLSEARGSLRVGELVLRQLIATRGEQLLSTVDVLASDFGFKSAVATQDQSTLRSVLANFGGRVDADLATLTEPSGALIAALPASVATGRTRALDDLLERARAAGGAAGLAIVGKRAYQLTLAPVKAPRLIAWAGMGFQIDQAMAKQLSGLLGLEVEFVVFEKDKELFHTGTLPETLTQDPGARSELISSRHKLLEAGEARLDVVLALDRGEVLAAYYGLARNLLAIFLITLLVSALIAIWLARKISQPVQDLSQFAKSVASGAYADEPQTRGVGELDTLAKALGDMQGAVRRRESRIRYQATHDALTDLLNREHTRAVTKEYLDEGRRFAAIRIAVHDFARINGAIGYELGDGLLQTVAGRLRNTFDSEHPLGRIEGNEFLLLIACDSSEQQLATELDRQRPALEADPQINQTPISFTLEMGVVMAPKHADNLEMLWRRSVIARDGSRADKGQTFFYREGQDEKRIRELTIIQGLEAALANEELHLVYQPQMTLADGSVNQVEVLARWIHPTLGFIPPDEFVTLAEHSGQIGKLTRWLIRQLARQLAQWRANGLGLGIAVNLSADEIADADLPTLIAPLLQDAAPEQVITLEVTESAMLRDPETATENLAQLRALGARIAVDDFGTGYSSLAQLKQLAAHELKIDKSLVLKLDTTPADQFIVKMITKLGHELGMEIVAEGVENDASWRYLAATGTDLMQGYFLARPMAIDELESWIRAHRHNQLQWTDDRRTGTEGR